MKADVQSIKNRTTLTTQAITQASPSTLATSQMSPFGLEIESMTVIAYVYIVKSRDAYDDHEWN